VGPGGSSFALFSPDNRWLMTLTGEKTVKWYQVGNWQVRGEFEVEFPVTELAFAPNGRWMAILGGFIGDFVSITSTHILNLTTGELVAKAIHSDYPAITVGGVVFKPGEEGLRTDLLHELPDWKTIATTGSDTSSPDGRWSVSESGLSAAGVFADSEIKSTQQEGGLHLREFSPDSRWLATTASKSEDTVKLWPLKLADLIKETCSRLPRILAREEWLRYLGEMPYHKTCGNLPGPKDITTP